MEPNITKEPPWPCPFCGGEAEEVITAQNTASPKYRIRCKVCGCQTPATVASPEHVRKWNARAERTCRNIADEWHKQYYEGYDSLCGTAFVCSECGARLCDCEDYFAFMGVPEGEDWREHRFEPVHFCPNCGCEVVKE